MKARAVGLAEIRRGCPNGHALCLRAACYLEPKGGRTMELRLTLRMDNAVFEGEPGPEVARILVELADRIGAGALVSGAVFHLFDANGNRVGSARVTGR